VPGTGAPRWTFTLLKPASAAGSPDRVDPAGRRGLICAGEKHWRGATPRTAMTHIAVQEALNSSAVEWLEQVSDEQYGG
jgi:hypothetical protein